MKQKENIIKYYPSGNKLVSFTRINGYIEGDMIYYSDGNNENILSRTKFKNCLLYGRKFNYYSTPTIRESYYHIKNNSVGYKLLREYVR